MIPVHIMQKVEANEALHIARRAQRVLDLRCIRARVCPNCGGDLHIIPAGFCDIAFKCQHCKSVWYDEE